jgi:hypothetical protein
MSSVLRVSQACRKGDATGRYLPPSQRNIQLDCTSQSGLLRPIPDDKEYSSASVYRIGWIDGNLAVSSSTHRSHLSPN